MKTLHVRELSREEQAVLTKGLQARVAFTVRRCQILLHSAKGKNARQIAAELHCSDETVRAVIHAFHEEGVNCLKPKSSRPHSATFSFSEAGLARLPEMVAASPRAYGVNHSLWSLSRLAQVCHQEGLTERVLSYETMRDALQRAGIQWKRARKRMQSTDAAYPLKKTAGSTD
jgi:transposase